MKRIKKYMILGSLFLGLCCLWFYMTEEEYPQSQGQRLQPASITPGSTTVPQQEYLGLTTLAEAEAYASLKPEIPSADGPLVMPPDYTTFLRAESKRADLNLQDYVNTLQELVQQRTHKNYAGNFIEKIYLERPTTFVVFGGLYGAFHSLVRDLGFLKQLDLLNDDFSLSKPDVYLIFLGDIVGGSPYITATHALIVRLMLVNQDHVIYLQGDLENNNTWFHRGFEKELAVRACSVSQEPVPCASLLMNFFSTLPRAVYLQFKDGNIFSLVRFSYYGPNARSFINEDWYGKFLFEESPTKQSLYHVVEEPLLPFGMKPSLRAFMTADSLLASYQSQFAGLYSRDEDKNSRIWSLLSSPNAVYQKTLGFQADSCAIIRTAIDADDWTITHYSQDVHAHNGFSTRTYSFFSGKLLPTETQGSAEQEDDSLSEKEAEEEEGYDEGEISLQDVSIE